MSVRDGDLAEVAAEDEDLYDYRQLREFYYSADKVLSVIFSLRRNFQKEFDTELFYLTAEDEQICFFVSDTVPHETDNMMFWVMGFLASAYPAAATFVPVPEDQRDVHTEHCCLEHGCKYSEMDCPVATGRKTQSIPCEQCDGQWLAD